MYVQKQNKQNGDIQIWKNKQEEYKNELKEKIKEPIENE